MSLLKNSIEQYQKDKKNITEDDLIHFHHILMRYYGWISVEEFEQLSITTVFNLLYEIEQEVRNPTPQPVYLVNGNG